MNKLFKVVILSFISIVLFSFLSETCLAKNISSKNFKSINKKKNSKLNWKKNNEARHKKDISKPLLLINENYNRFPYNPLHPFLRYWKDAISPAASVVATGDTYSGPGALIITLNCVDSDTGNVSDFIGWSTQNSNNGNQDMVIGSHTSSCIIDQPYIISGYCESHHKGAPSEGDVLSDPWMRNTPTHWTYWVQKAVEYGVDNNMEEFIQDAVWYITDRDESATDSYNDIIKAIGYDEINGPRKPNGLDEQPPGQVSNLSINSNSSPVILSWTNPSDNDFLGVTVCRSTEGFPQDTSEGEVIYNQILEPGASISIEVPQSPVPTTSPIPVPTTSPIPSPTSSPSPNPTTSPSPIPTSSPIPSTIQLINPNNGSITNSTNVTFEWSVSKNRETMTYHLYLGKQPDLSDAQVYDMASSNFLPFHLAGMSIIFMGMFVNAAGNRKKRIKYYILIVLLCSLFLTFSIPGCSGSSGGSDSSSPENPGSTYTYTVNNLEPATTYYWKIVEQNEQGEESSSNTWEFKTPETQVSSLTKNRLENINTYYSVFTYDEVSNHSEPVTISTYPVPTPSPSTSPNPDNKPVAIVVSASGNIEGLNQDSCTVNVEGVGAITMYLNAEDTYSMVWSSSSTDGSSHAELPIGSYNVTAICGSQNHTGILTVVSNPDPYDPDKDNVILFDFVF